MISFEELKLHTKIKQIRELKNLTREFVAAELNIDTRTYSYIESGKSSITVKRLYELCNIFNCSLEEFLKFNSGNIFNFNVKQEEGNQGANINYQEVKNEKELYISLVKAKDEIIKTKDEIIKVLNNEISIMKK
jgi:transcriptional regulator with XRE-family HTH domain